MAILDDPIEVKITSIEKVSFNGDLHNCDTLMMYPPKPSSARLLYKIKGYFSKLQRETAKDFMGMAKQAERPLELEAGTEVASLHEKYSDDSPDLDKIKADMEEQIEHTTQLFELGQDRIDVYQLTADFCKLLLTPCRGGKNNLCKVMISSDDSSTEEKFVPLTNSIWETQITPEDRLSAVIRYCCFFGLTFSTAL